VVVTLATTGLLLATELNPLLMIAGGALVFLGLRL
jgi:hypothetical protein